MTVFSRLATSRREGCRLSQQQDWDKLSAGQAFLEPIANPNCEAPIHRVTSFPSVRCLHRLTRSRRRGICHEVLHLRPRVKRSYCSELSCQCECNIPPPIESGYPFCKLEAYATITSSLDSPRRLVVARSLLLS